MGPATGKHFPVLLLNFPLDGVSKYVMIRKNDIRVPDGYFEDLQARLSAIPGTSAAGQAPHGIRRLAPYAAVAASMLLAVTVGNWILQRTAVRDVQGDYDSMLIAEVLGSDNLDFYLEEDSGVESLSDEDIVNYLIASGTTVEQLNYASYEEDR